MLANETSFKHLSVSELHHDLAENKYVVVDIRDENSFQASHIPGSIHLTNDSLAQFLRDADFDQSVVVCCYHGISSQQAADFLISQDFTDVYSLDGGFVQWQQVYPTDIES